MNFLKGRGAVLISFIILFATLSFIVRTSLLFWTFSKAGFSISNIFTLYFKGLVFDLGVANFFVLLYSVYLVVLPQKWNKTIGNRIFTYLAFFIATLIIVFSFFAEFPFWGEFESRFNFIAVDYLIYTFEVVNNINESYPLPILISCMLLITIALVYVVSKLGAFKISFQSNTAISKRLITSIVCIVIAIIYAKFIPNRWAEKGSNRYGQELAKSGIYSFFSAFKDNELSYSDFYLKQPSDQVFSNLRNELSEAGATFSPDARSVLRSIKADSNEVRPNVIMITIESFSAEFMARFGDTKGLTPFLNALADSSLLFTNMYSTGTRTVRGMEALTLAVPPTPGSSIVRRQDNGGLFSVGSIFKAKGYDRTFFYGGDGYFDNMNHYFSGNGFDIVDKGSKIIPGDEIVTKRTVIPDSAIHFTNAWGIADEDLYNAVIRDADAKHSQGRLFFNFVMTTSNHKPFTYPEGKVDIPSGQGRDGAVKYTDYAIKQFINSIKNKPWFNNTVIVLVADHCANSAGVNEVEIEKYHIPCIVYNLKNVSPAVISPLCSQLDLYPTLFKMLGWSYESRLFGKDVLEPNFEPRTFVSTYQKLGFLQNDTLILLSPLQKTDCLLWDSKTGKQTAVPMNQNLLNKAVANYQGAYELFKSGKMKE